MKMSFPTSRLEAGSSRLCKSFGPVPFMALLVGDTFRVTLKVKQLVEDRADSMKARTSLKELLSTGIMYFHYNGVIAGIE